MSRSELKGMYVRGDLRTRLLAKIAVDPITGCWLWKAAKNNKGYGVLRVGDGNVYAHRASWVTHFGEVKTGQCVLHRCDVPACINPDHLFVGSHADNTADMLRKGRNRGWPKGRPFPREVVERRTATRLRRSA
ncbi:MAG: HNH endonuclease [Myxococcaceae bacterium]|nr:HNH endonuclease [Myxococcaceae bacterium]